MEVSHMKFTIHKKLWFVICLIHIISLVGCSKISLFENETAAKEEELGRELPIELYVQEEIKSGKYEPDTGIYTGAYVQKDDNIQGDLLTYEELIGQKQTFKVFAYKAQEGITKQEILRCIAQKKTPYIKLVLDTSYDLTPLYQLIFDLKESYHIPIFIELYPLTEKDYEVKAYKETYQRAYEILHKYLSNIVVVWSTDESRVMDMALYYPGNSYVDWVGLNVYMPRYKNGEKYNYDVTKNLEYWYKSYQEKKPLLISSLAISHFSRVDHAYAIQETKDQLTLFYDKILENYPRLKGIIYVDVDMAKVSQKGQDDYRLTGQPALMETMKNLSLPLKIHATLQEDEKKINCYMKYNIIGTYFDEALYIPQEYMALCFKEVPLKKIKYIQNLSGELFYAYEDIQKYYMTYYKA